jgi:hypothetical protein
MVAAVEKLQEEEGERERRRGEILMREGGREGCGRERCVQCTCLWLVATPFLASNLTGEEREVRGLGCAGFRKRDEFSLLGHVFFSWDAYIPNVFMHNWRHGQCSGSCDDS